MTGDMQEYYHMRKHIRHIADADRRNEFVGNQNPAVEFPPTLAEGDSDRYIILLSDKSIL